MLVTGDFVIFGWHNLGTILSATACRGTGDTLISFPGAPTLTSTLPGPARLAPHLTNTHTRYPDGCIPCLISHPNVLWHHTNYCVNTRHLMKFPKFRKLLKLSLFFGGFSKNVFSKKYRKYWFLLENVDFYQHFRKSWEFSNIFQNWSKICCV